MSHLDAALRRAMADGVLPRTVVELTTDVVYDPAAFLPEASPRRSPSGDSPPKTRVVERSDDRPFVLELHAPLAPTAASQLANLVQTLQLHPAKPRTVAFVASGRNEGTTTCVANLGIYLATRHAKVLMVDANLQWPALHTIASVDRGPGLMEVMAGQIDLKRAIKPASVPDLFMLTSGELHTAGTNGLVLPSALRERLLNRTNDYDFVLVDCPAVNAYEDAAVMAATCDAVILVVEGGRTLREEAQASKALLTRAHCKILGVFMNKRKFYVPKFLYDRL